MIDLDALQYKPLYKERKSTTKKEMWSLLVIVYLIIAIEMMEINFIKVDLNFLLLLYYLKYLSNLIKTD